ncbi:MAG: carboxymuconolactone decarboxylase family protein [Candidatus Dormibacteria bacterium]
MEHAHEVLRELGGQGRHLRESIPEVYSGFAALDKAAMADGELSAKHKQLVALAIAVTRECDGCIASHARAAASAGASRQEVAEALGVAILMNGGPGTVWAPRAIAAFEEYAVKAG